LTLGNDFNIHPEFHKCFYKDCQTPEPDDIELPPPMVDCNFMDCLGGMPPAFAHLRVKTNQRMIIDETVLKRTNGRMQFSSIFIDGTLVIPASSFTRVKHLTIEADSVIVNSGAGGHRELLSRRRRETVNVSNGGLIIGTEDDPIPCDVTITIKLTGDKFSKSYGAFPGSIPIGAKALGGMGGVQMFGCQIYRTWTTLKTTVSSGNTITVNDDVSALRWKIGDKIALATTDYEHRHTEYFTITGLNGENIILDKNIKWKHIGTEDGFATIRGQRQLIQAAEVVLLSRNIKIDGFDGADGKVGGRVLITSIIDEKNGHKYLRTGFGQFSFVEFRGMGQFGYNNFDDLRAQLLFYGVNTAADPTTGRPESFVKGCAFHEGFHTAIAAMFDTDGLVIDNNSVFGCVDSAIRTDSKKVTITNNVVGNIYQFQLWENYVEQTVNTNFADDQMPAGIMTEETNDVIISFNRVAGVDGSCYSGHGEQCGADEVGGRV